MSMKEVFNELDQAKGILEHVPGHDIGADLMLLASVGTGVSKHIINTKQGLTAAKQHMPEYYGHAQTSATRGTQASSHLFSAMLEVGGIDDINPKLSQANAHTVAVTKAGETMVEGYRTMEEQLDKALEHIQGLGAAVVEFLQAQQLVEAARKESEGHAAAAVQQIDEYTQPLR